ncbi:MAG: hypothetical protein WCS92_00680 [Candidatus Babeliales bacterium]|jgi:hypothetical protein|nr:MAG: hypothetical protein US22_C0013G0006 [candidate division TM6 bacterium GW2011_GWF2_36_6]
MNKFSFFAVLIMCFIKLNADNRIILYLKTAPTNIINQALAEAKNEAIPEKNKQTLPSKTVKKQINGARTWLVPKLSGFVAIYAGFIDISDRDGLISFPLRHVTPKLNIAITEQINLLKVKENTIAHREFLPRDKAQTKLYNFERKEDVDPQDPTKKTQYWSVQEIPLPADNKINPLTLVIFAKPSNIYVPVGDFMSVESSHLVLPEIYVIGNKNQSDILFQTLDITRYFEPITKEQEKIDDKKDRSLIKNI